ncbi:MAG: peptide chain release factor N(5)-glutamine methyltransferase [Gammaproteobacteria bacterium]|nr:peptide chain release factor N(5)-glutamine methyltransferase [Gammaproteobacteria bacterium]
MLTIKDILTSATAQLSSVSDSAKLDSELLLSFLLNKPRTYLHTWPDVTLNDEAFNKFNRLLERRMHGEPIAHIVGKRGFWSLNLKVTADTLIPRPDTERLVELALEIIPQPAQWKILDLGTGTGAIALSLAKERQACFITATDQSTKALEVAKQNAANNQINNIEFIQSNWFEKLENRYFDMIVSNPPYICDNDPHLKIGDVRFEPLSALTAGADGLNDIRTIINNSHHYLNKNGVLLIEHGFDQADVVCDLLKTANFIKVRNFKDYGGNPRVSIGHIK